jgi:hypothetical protein
MNLEDRKAITKLLKDQGSIYDSYLALYFLIKKLGLLGTARINILILKHLAVSQVIRRLNEKT